MTQRERNGATPISWLQVAGFVLVLWAASSDVLAQVRDMLVTEVRGTAVRATGKAGAAVRALDTLKVGDRVRLSSDSHMGLFHPGSAELYWVEGPGEAAVDSTGVKKNGKPVVARKLNDAYRNIKLDSRELVQGSLVMRSSATQARAVAPEGVVSPGAARSLEWTGGAGPWYVEIALESGALIHGGSATGSEYTVPEGVALRDGERYVWAVARHAGEVSSGDWTEFAVRTDTKGVPSAPDAAATDSDRLLYSAWLRAQGLHRAASRAQSPTSR